MLRNVSLSLPQLTAIVTYHGKIDSIVISNYLFVIFLISHSYSKVSFPSTFRTEIRYIS